MRPATAIKTAVIRTVRIVVWFFRIALMHPNILYHTPACYPNKPESSANTLIKLGT